jgi:hypothetical protein
MGDRTGGIKSTREESRSRLVALAAASGSLVLISLLSVATPTPSILSPYSVAVVLPYFIGGPFLAYSVCPILFLLSGVHLLRGESRVPVLSSLVFFALSASSAVWMVWGWNPGLRHYGFGHTATLFALNGAILAALLGLHRKARRRPSFPKSLLFHWLLWAWVGWGAFGWLRQLF